MRLAVLMSLASPWSREAAWRLSELGHRIHVIDFARSTANTGYLSVCDNFQASSISSFREAVAGCHLIESPFSSGLRYFTSALRLRKILRGCGAEALLTLYGGGFATVAYVSGFRPYAVYVVGSDILLVRTIRRTITRAALTAASSVFANGAYLAEKARELAPEADVVPIYLGVDTARFSPGCPPAEPVRIVCTRGFLPVYNNEYLVRGLAEMPDILADFAIAFTSAGPLLDTVRTLADELLPTRIRRNVEFLGGVNSECLVESLKRAHIYVSLSRSDGTSTSLLEALACGLFPVVSDIPQNREWIDPEAGNGILVPLDQPRELAASLILAISDPGRRMRAAEYNRRLVIERANSPRNMATLAAKLESIARSRLIETPEQGRAHVN